MQDSLATRIHSHRPVISLIAAIAIVFAAVPIGYHALFLANSRVVTGIAVDLGGELTDNTKGSRPAGSALVIEFTTAAGKTIRFDGGPAASTLYTDIGDRVPVRYDPANPEHAMVDRDFLFFRLVFLPLLVGGAGAAALLTVGWAMLVSRNRASAEREF